jgi:hypothetical protein
VGVVHLLYELFRDFGSNIASDAPGLSGMLVFPLLSSHNFDTRFMKTGDNELVRISKGSVAFFLLLYTNPSFQEKCFPSKLFVKQKLVKEKYIFY